MSNLLPQWQKANPVEDPNMDLHDFQGAGIRYMDDDDSGSSDCAECESDLEDCETQKADLEQEISDLEEELDDVINGRTFYKTGSGFFDDPGHGSLTSTITVGAALDPANSIIGFSFVGNVIVVGDPRLAGGNQKFGDFKQFNPAGTVFKDIDYPTTWFVNEAFPSFSASRDVAYDPTFSVGGGYISALQTVYATPGPTVVTEFRWYL